MHTVREFVQAVFSAANLDWQDYVVIDPTYFRPTEVYELCGDLSRAATKLGWQPKACFADQVRIMVEADPRDAGLIPGELLRQTVSRGGA